MVVVVVVVAAVAEVVVPIFIIRSSSSSTLNPQPCPRYCTQGVLLRQLESDPDSGD